MSSAEQPARAERSASGRVLSGWELASLGDHGSFPPGGEALYRRIAQLIDLGAADDFVVVPCGNGVTARFLAETSGASGAGTDEPRAVEAARSAARQAGLGERLHFEAGTPDNLPFTDEVFDVAVGELGLAAAADPAAAVAELARVTRRMGVVVLIQLTWTRDAPPAHRAALVERLGLRPFLLVEWKQMLRDAGVVDLHVEDWSDAVAAPQSWSVADLAGIRSLRPRATLFRRVWREHGFRGVRQLTEHDRRIRRLLTGERMLGLSLIRGTRWQ